MDERIKAVIQQVLAHAIHLCAAAVERCHRLPSLSIPDYFDGAEQTYRAHLANRGVLLTQIIKVLAQSYAHLLCVFNQLIVFYNIDVGDRSGQRDRVRVIRQSAVIYFVGEELRDLVAHRNCTKRSVSGS